VRKQTLRKDFHYDQKKQISNLTSLIHTFAVQQDAMTGNFCFNLSPKLRARQARELLDCTCATSFHSHCYTHPLTCTFCTQKGVSIEFLQVLLTLTLSSKDQRAEIKLHYIGNNVQ